MKKSELKILQINAQSIKTVDNLKNKLVELKTLVALKKPDVVSICETWLNETVLDKEILSTDQWNIYRKDRKDPNENDGGGVLVAVTKNLNSDHRKDLQPDVEFHNEMLVVQLTQANKEKIGIVSVYRPPSDLNLLFADNLKACLDNLWHDNTKEIMVIGDLNFPEMNWEYGYPQARSGLCYDVASTLNDYGLIQLNDNPSREVNNNILDVILLNEPENLIELQCYKDILHTDHFILELDILFDEDLHPTDTRYAYDFSKAKYDKIKSKINSGALQNQLKDITDQPSLDQAVKSWTESFICLCRNSIPNRKIKPRNTTPWIDREVRHQSNKKETRRRRAKKSNRQRDWAKYRQENNKLQALIHTKHKDYVNQCAREINTNPKRFWNLVNSNNKASGFPKEMELDQKKAVSDSEKANLFNDFFTSVFNLNEATSLPEIKKVINPRLTSLQVDHDMVRKLLVGLDANKALGPDKIPTKVLKECASEVAESLTYLFNKSLQLGLFPTPWKDANVCPVYKKGRKKDIRNYRPISLLSIVSKVLERCVYQRLIEVLGKDIHYLQHGFMKDRSTNTQLLLVYDFVNKIIDSRGQVDCIYLDLSKAFDSVSHRLLLHKLTTYGVGRALLAWIGSYLSNRRQRCNVGSQYSNWSKVTSGVPQGSILGPLLFLLYINDMPRAIASQDCYLALYADDAKLYRQIIDNDDTMDLQIELDHITEWSNTWELNFNSSKCKYMRISRKTLPIRTAYTMGQTRLERVNSFVDLGIIIQDNLLWDEHINNMIKRANRNLWFIKRSIGIHATSDAKKTLYVALVRSILEYGTIIWTPISKQNLRHIESIQRKATKLICRNYYISYKERLALTNLLPLSFRRETLDLNFFKKGRAGIFGQDIKMICNIKQDRQNRRLDPNNSLVKTTKVKSETYAHYFTNRIIRSWNSLPHEVRDMPFNRTSSVFRNRIKQIYINKLTNTFNVDNDCTWVTRCRCSKCRA
jgi:hypothetical protein